MTAPRRSLFGTDGIRGVANVHPMTPELALALGRAVTFVGGPGKGPRAARPRRQGHPPLGVHARDRDRRRGDLDGRARPPVRPDTHAGGGPPHGEHAGRRRPRHQRQPQPVRRQRHQDLRGRRLQAARPRGGGDPTPVADVTTVDLDAYHAYFEGEDRLNRLDFDGAGKAFHAAIARDSTFALAYYRLAYTEWWARGQQALARRHVAYAMRNLQRIPYKERFLVRALSAGLEDGFNAQALILREMRRLYPDDKEMLFGLGDAEFHAGSVDSAIVHFEAALAIDPVMERALQHLTWTYQRKGLDADAPVSLPQPGLRIAPDGGNHAGHD